jgi:hypothetical protein
LLALCDLAALWLAVPDAVARSWRGMQAERAPHCGGMTAGSFPVVTSIPSETTDPTEPSAKYMLIFRGGAVSRDDVSPSALQQHLEKWYTWADELARQGRRNVGTPLDSGGKSVWGHERVVTDGPYAESKDLVTGAMIIDAVSLDDAVEVARGCPTYEFGGSVEVRPLQD